MESAVFPNPPAELSLDEELGKMLNEHKIPMMENTKSKRQEEAFEVKVKRADFYRGMIDKEPIEDNNGKILTTLNAGA